VGPARDFNTHRHRCTHSHTHSHTHTPTLTHTHTHRHTHKHTGTHTHIMCVFVFVCEYECACACACACVVSVSVSVSSVCLAVGLSVCPSGLSVCLHLCLWPSSCCSCCNAVSSSVHTLHELASSYRESSHAFWLGTGAGFEIMRGLVWLGLNIVRVDLLVWPLAGNGGSSGNGSSTPPAWVSSSGLQRVSSSKWVVGVPAWVSHRANKKPRRANQTGKLASQHIP
jgi:hypothetical protein